MHISSLRIDNIRSIQLAKLSFSPSLNVIVGENNVGKSTLLDAILLLQQPRLGERSVRFGASNGKVRIDLTHIDPALFEKRLAKAFAQLQAIPQHCAVTFSIGDDGLTGRIRLRPEAEDHFYQFSQRQPDNFLVPFLSSRRTAGLQTRVGSEYTDQLNGTLEHVQPKIDRCYSSPALRQRYENACMTVLGTVVSPFHVEGGKAAGVEFDPISPRGRAQLAEMGAGVVQALGLVVELLTARNKVFVIEELENDLHPKALRCLMQLIEESAAAGCQFFVSTHSNIVLRHLGSVRDARTFHVVPEVDPVPRSNVVQVANDPDARREILSRLGYELSDYDLYDAWLILEESSAERIIREFLIRFFAPKLEGRLRTVAAQGADDVRPRFMALKHLFTFLHLEGAYTNKAWVLVDGDEKGCGVVERLRKDFSQWPQDHFRTLREERFENYYPLAFREKVRAIFSLDKSKQQDAKKQLLNEVVLYLRQDESRARSELQGCARDVIEVLHAVESALTK